MKDLRCMVNLHAFPMPGKDHPVKASDVEDGQLTLECSRCHRVKRVVWAPGARREAPLKGNHIGLIGGMGGGGGVGDV